MSEQESGVAVEETQDNFEYPISIEDAGPATKKISIEIPGDRIQSKLAEQFDQVLEMAALPGFRPGKAPRKLVERRFGGDVRNQVRDSLVREAYQQAVTKNSLAVLGEPEFDEGTKLELPESGSLKFQFNVEIQPEITLPDFKDLTVKRPVITVNDTHVDQAMQNLREQQGTLVPVEDRGVKSKDYVTADIDLKMDGEVVGNMKNAQLVSRPGNVGGIEVKDLDKQLEGAKVGDTRTVKVTAPENHPAEKLRGKDVEVEFKINDIKYLELAEIDDDFLEQLGFVNEQELRDELKVQMTQRIENDIKVAMHNQVRNYLAKNVTVDLPQKLTQRQEHRVANRRANEAMMRGVGQEQIKANLNQLYAGALDQAKAELKLFFTLGKLAEQHEITVDEAEVNGQIAEIAMQQEKRPEQLKQKMSESGQLSELYLAMRERKTLDKVIEGLKIEDVEIKPDQTAEDVSPEAKDVT
ncbi:MAG TPA: trigger factor [Tepidisphaeraceae bacterium]|nr:trigger factor [Tepidisphaeraceae bacterium]